MNSRNVEKMKKKTRNAMLFEPDFHTVKEGNLPVVDRLEEFLKYFCLLRCM